RVVDQNAYGEREPAQRRRVEGLAQEIEHQYRRDDRQRNGAENDQGDPPIAEKQQDHQRGQRRRHQAAHDDAVQGGFHEYRLIKKRREGPAGRQQVAQLRQNAVGAVDHRQRRTAAALADNNQHDGRTVSSNRVGLHLVTVVHVHHVPDEHGPAIDLLDGKRIDLVDARWAVVQRYVVVLAADLHVTRRHDDVLSRERLSDVARGQA